MNFSSAKECLLHFGKIEKITRGRISAGNHEFIAERIALGDTIGGYEVKVSTKPTGDVVHSNAKSTASGEKIISDIGTARYDERQTQAYYFFDGKKKPIGMREVCANCGSSFTYHFCDTPLYRTLDNEQPVPVYFGVRTTPFVKGY